MPQSNVMGGIEKIELAPAFTDIADAATAVWRRVENIAPGSVTYTNNADTKTNITPEDKDSPIVVLYTPGDPDTFNFASLELSPENYAELFNVEYTAATTTTTILARRKNAALAIRVTTRPINGTKNVLVFPNTSVTATLENNFTKDALVQISAVADILAFATASGEDGLYTKQIVNADGTVIDSTPAG